MVQCSGPGLVNNEGGRARQHHAALRALTISIIITINHHCHHHHDHHCHHHLEGQIGLLSLSEV